MKSWYRLGQGWPLRMFLLHKITQPPKNKHIVSFIWMAKFIEIKMQVVAVCEDPCTACPRLQVSLSTAAFICNRVNRHTQPEAGWCSLPCWPSCPCMVTPPFCLRFLISWVGAAGFQCFRAFVYLPDALALPYFWLPLWLHLPTQTTVRLTCLLSWLP